MNTQQQQSPQFQNLLTPISLDFTLQSLKALNTIWNYRELYYPEIHIGDAEKAMPSVLLQVAKKLSKKQLTRQIGIHKKEDFPIKLEPFEAFFLEVYIRGIASHLPYGYERTVALKRAGEINQLLS